MEFLAINDQSESVLDFHSPFAILAARIGEKGLESEKNDWKFNLTGGLPAEEFSLPASITTRIGQSGVRLCQTLYCYISSYPHNYIRLVGVFDSLG